MSSRADPYEILVALIERELMLVGEGRWDELPALNAERDELLATLPAAAPEEARDALERARAVQSRVTTEIMRHRELILLESATVQRASRAARGYAPPRSHGISIGA
jgi:hypothetical protein